MSMDYRQHVNLICINFINYSVRTFNNFSDVLALVLWNGASRTRNAASCSVRLVNLSATCSAYTSESFAMRSNIASNCASAVSVQYTLTWLGPA